MKINSQQNGSEKQLFILTSKNLTPVGAFKISDQNYGKITYKNMICCDWIYSKATNVKF